MRFDHDRHRPAYHFLPPQNWLNDPNGLLYWQGQYHLFYQHNPNRAAWGSIHWGHAVSADMVNWTHLPVALAPTPNSPDESGCWSGCMVANDGTPTLLYTGVRGPMQATDQSVCVATSVDKDLVTWQKATQNPVITSRSTPYDLIGFRDPSVWHEGNRWYLIIGAGAEPVGGAILYYTSDDLLHWDYQGPLLTGQQLAGFDLWVGSMWECPQLLRFGDDAVLTFSVWDADQTHYSVYVSGTLQDGSFTPQYLAKLDFGDHHCYAPQSLVDADGRNVMFAWNQEARSVQAQLDAGWSGALTLPRVLSLDTDKRLISVPLPALSALRTNSYVAPPDLLASVADTPVTLDPLHGDTLEIAATFMPASSGRLGLLVGCSPDGQEHTRIYYDVDKQEISIDRSQSSLDPDPDLQRTTQTGPCPVTPGQTLNLRVFVDRSLIEVFANGRSLSSRVYPAREDSLGTAVFVEGDSRLNALQGWHLGTPNLKNP